MHIGLISILEVSAVVTFLVSLSYSEPLEPQAFLSQPLHSGIEKTRSNANNGKVRVNAGSPKHHKPSGREKSHGSHQRESSNVSARSFAEGIRDCSDANSKDNPHINCNLGFIQTRGKVGDIQQKKGKFLE